MSMIVSFAKTIVEQVCRDNEDNSGDQHPGGIMNKEFFHYQEGKAGKEKKKRHEIMVMFPVTMIQ